MHRIRKGQFKLGKLRTTGKTAPEIWNAVLALWAKHALDVLPLPKVCTTTRAATKEGGVECPFTDTWLGR
jgi:hypothetical protein